MTGNDNDEVVTPEMIEAGRSAMAAWSGVIPPTRLEVVEIYLAMRRVAAGGSGCGGTPHEIAAQGL